MPSGSVAQAAAPLVQAEHVVSLLRSKDLKTALSPPCLCRHNAMAECRSTFWLAAYSSWVSISNNASRASQ